MATNPKGYSYSQRPNAEYQRFKEEYYSGQDARIYFGNTWVDEIVDLRFQLIENTAPIFGYASYTWDAVAHGNRQIQGTFRINFKESYYLHSIVNQLEHEVKKTVAGPIANTKAPTQKVSVPHLRNAIDAATSNSEFEKLALEFERSLWGSSSNKNLQNYADTRGNQAFFAPESTRPNVSKDGFSIVLLYGPYKETYSGTMKTENTASTVRTLTGVHLTGVSQAMDNSGQPIYEDYSFIARDLDSNVNLRSDMPKYSFGILSDN